MDKGKAVLYILVVSLIANMYFAYRYVTARPTIVVDSRVIEKPVEIVKIKTRWKIVRVPITVRPPGSADAILEEFEHTTPELSLQPLYLYKDEDGIVHVPEYLGGSLQLGYLHWDLMAKLDLEVEYTERPLNLRCGLLGGVYHDNNVPKTFTDINLMYPIWGFNVGVGIQSATLTKGWRIYSQTELDFGVGYLYNTGFAGILGVSFKL